MGPQKQSVPSGKLQAGRYVCLITTQAFGGSKVPTICPLKAVKTKSDACVASNRSGSGHG